MGPHTACREHNPRLRRGGQHRGLRRHPAATDCARTYRPALRELAALPVLNAFYLTTDEKTVTRFDVGDFVGLGSVGRRS
jgi:hypothetical protein